MIKSVKLLVAFISTSARMWGFPGRLWASCTWGCIGAAVFLVLSVTAVSFAGGNNPSYDKPGSYTVITREMADLVDPKRDNRSVPMAIYFPSQGLNFPLVVMSHGAGGNTASMEYQAKHLASYGYVVVCPEHVYSNNKQFKYYMSRQGGNMSLADALQEMTIDPRAIFGRPKDISFTIDQMLLLNDTDSQLRGKINKNEIGMMGDSFGAYTTLVVCGAQPIRDYLKPNMGKGLAGDFSDDRVKFGLAMSPQTPGSVYFGVDSYQTINRPLVCLTGSRDVQKGFDGKKMPPKSRLELIELLPAGDKYFLWLKGSDHLSFADNNANLLFPSFARKDTQRITKAMMVVFSNYFLKNDKSMLNYMTEDYVNSLCGKIVRKVSWTQK